MATASLSESSKKSLSSQFSFHHSEALSYLLQTPDFHTEIPDLFVSPEVLICNVSEADVIFHVLSALKPKRICCTCAEATLVEEIRSDLEESSLSEGSCPIDFIEATIQKFPLNDVGQFDLVLVDGTYMGGKSDHYFLSTFIINIYQVLNLSGLCLVVVKSVSVSQVIPDGAGLCAEDLEWHVKAAHGNDKIRIRKRTYVHKGNATTYLQIPGKGREMQKMRGTSHSLSFGSSMPSPQVKTYRNCWGETDQENAAAQHLDQDAQSAEESDEELVASNSDAPSFFDYRLTFPFLDQLKAHSRDIVEEMTIARQSRWAPWPEDHYDPEKGHDWRVFPFCYTFPSYDASKTTWVDATCSICPKTTAILKSLPNLRTALFSRLGPKTTLAPHRGWAELSNYVLRCHLGLTIPEQGQYSGMWVDGEVVHHQQGEVLVFDDSKLHYAFNDSQEERTILIMDFARPEDVALGTATGARTEQLDDFIAKFGIIS